MRLFTSLTIALLAMASVHATDGFGEVSFANSGSRAAQADFLEGLALLHDFEYAPAAEAFRRAQAADPDFAMAYWGEAMTCNHPIWFQQDLEAGRAALEKLAATPEERLAKAKTERERAYLQAVEILYGAGSKYERDFLYRDAMESLHGNYPTDVDAAAFHGLAILGTAHAGRDVAVYMRAAGILEEAWKDHRDHPGLVHYLIHSYDDPTHAPLGLRAARIYARVAPKAAHAQHMTSHIFLALGMWQESVDANLAAIAAAGDRRRAAGREPVLCGHYPSWLEYSYLQLGQMEDARRTLAACRQQVSGQATDNEHASHSMDPDTSLTGSFANMRLRYLLDTADWGGEAAGWALPAGAGPGAVLDFAFARTLGEIAGGEVPAARQALTELEAAARAVSDIETKNANPDPTYRLRPDIFLLQAKGLLAEKEGDLAAAERFLLEAVAIEEKLPVAFGPPTIDKPTHELLAEFLLRRDRKEEAQAEFEKAIARTPGRRLAVQGREATKGSL